MNTPGTVTLDPAILKENKSMELFAKILDHVVPLWLTVHQKVKTSLLLKSDNDLNLMFDKFVVLCLSNFAFAQLGTSRAYFFRLLHGSLGARNMKRQRKYVLGMNQW